MSEEQAKRVRVRQGVVLKNKMDKSVVVEVVRQYQHRKYLKLVRRRIRYKAHDEENTCNVGDTVLLEESRPLSKTKRWTVKDIWERATEL